MRVKHLLTAAILLILIDLPPISLAATAAPAANPAPAAGTSQAGTGACATNKFVTAVNNNAPPTCAQPAFSNLSGSAAASQLPPATATSQGALQLSGDLTGTSGTPKVAGLQGQPVSTGAPTANQVLTWNGSAWAPATPSGGGGGTVTSVGLAMPPQFAVIGSPITNSGTVSTTWNSFNANTILAGPTSGSAAAPNFRSLVPADLPGATGSAPGAIQLSGDLGGTSSAPKVTWLQGYALSPATPSANQVLTWNGAAWAPASPAAGAGLGSCPANQYVTATTSGTPTCAQPAFSSLAGIASAAQLPTATGTAPGALTLAGDLAGTAGSPQVTSAHFSSALPIAQGGTGQSTGSAAFNALAPPTAPGGLVLGTGSNTYGNLPLGGNGTCLTSNGSTASWAACTTGGGGGGATSVQFDANPALTGTINVASGMGLSSSQSGQTVTLAVNNASPTLEGILALTGDLTGTAVSPKVAGLEGIPVSNTAPANGQCLTYNGASWIPGSCGSGGGGSFTPAGDLSGTSTSQTVVGLQTRPVSNTTPSSGQFLSWNGSSWAPANAPSGSFAAAGDLSGSSSSQTVVGLQSWPVSNASPATGQVLQWNGAAWTPASSSGGANAIVSNPSSTQTITPSSPTVTGLVVNSAASPTVDLLDVKKNGAIQFHIDQYGETMIDNGVLMTPLYTSLLVRPNGNLTLSPTGSLILSPSGAGTTIQATTALKQAVNNIPFSTTPTLDLSKGNVQQFTCSTAGSSVNPTLANLAAGEALTVIFAQNGTAPCSWTWPSTIHGGGTVSTSLGGVSVQEFIVSNNGTDAYAKSAMSSASGGTL